MGIIRNIAIGLIPLLSSSALIAAQEEQLMQEAQRYQENAADRENRRNDDNLGLELEDEIILGVDSPEEAIKLQADLDEEPLIQAIEYLDQFPEDVGRILTYVGGIPIIASPYIGNITPFDGSHLITSFPRTRLDINILRQRQNIENFMLQHEVESGDKPFVAISGDIEITPFIQSRDGGSSSAGIDLDEIYLAITAGINAWVTGYTAIAFDSSSPAEGGSTVSNSNLFIDQGFITIGNLNRAPFYGTLGQTYVPFGRYANYFVNQTLPRALGRTKAREVAIGYQQPADSGFYATAFAFDADSGPHGRGSFKNGAYGTTVSYNLSTEQTGGEFGLGYISTITDSLGMQNLAGFGMNADAEIVNHHVPALNAYVRYNVGQFGLSTEYVGAIFRSFDENDLAINGKGANPQAWDVQAAYFFEAFEKPSSVALGYSGTSDAAALMLPENRISLGYNTSWWRNTVQQIELRRDIGYGKNTVATGPKSRNNNINGPIAIAPSATAVTLMMGVYY